MRADRYYSQCQRCGNPQAGDHARTLESSKRLVCSTCFYELPWDERGWRVDDGVTRSWPETLELRKQRQLSTYVDKG